MNRKLLSGAFLAIALVFPAQADVTVPSKKKKKAEIEALEAKIAELEATNHRLRAENILLKNKLAMIEKVETERISNVERNSREALGRLIPHLRFHRDPDNPNLPQLRFSPTPIDPFQPQDADAEEEKAAPAPPPLPELKPKTTS